MGRQAMRAWASFALLALLAGGALGEAHEQGWTHQAGDGAHSGVAYLGEKPLDVVATYQLVTEPNARIWQMLSTPYGPTGLVNLQVPPIAVCQLFRVSDLQTGRVERFGPTVPCPDDARLLGYDAPRDQLLVTFDGRPTDPMVQAWDARTGEVKWGASMAVVFEPAGFQNQLEWTIGDLAIDEAAGVVYVPFAMDFTARNLVQAIDLADGKTIWATQLDATKSLNAPPISPTPDPNVTRAVGLAAQGYQPRQITLTADGIVTIGLQAGAVSGGAVWLDRDGRVVGGAFAPPQPSGDPATGSAASSRSDWAASSGTLAAFVLERSLYVVDPVNQGAVPIPMEGAEAFVGTIPGPAWSREALVVPLRTTALMYPAGDTASPRLWPGFEGSEIWQLLIAPPADAYAIVGRLTLDGPVMDLVRIDLASARTIDRVPVPIPPEDLIDEVHMLPLGEGRLLVWSALGGAVLFDEAPDALRPQIDLDNLYPAAGEALSLVARTTSAARDLSVAWGDGVLDRAQVDVPVEHAYEDPGRRVVRVVALYPDNRTGTAEMIVNVGGTPPAQLTLLQRAFAPERENFTFGVIGLAVTGIGGLIAYGSRLRRKSRLQTDLVELERLRQLGKTEPYRAAKDLASYRTRIRKDLAEGALDDAQFTALSSEALRLLGTLRLRLVGDLEGRASPRFRHQLETALEDGSVTPDELQALRATLAAEAGLTPSDKERLATLLEGWATTGA